MRGRCYGLVWGIAGVECVQSVLLLAELFLLAADIVLIVFEVLQCTAKLLSDACFLIE